MHCMCAFRFLQRCSYAAMVADIEVLKVRRRGEGMGVHWRLRAECVAQFATAR